MYPMDTNGYVVINYTAAWLSVGKNNCRRDTGRFCARQCFGLAENKFCLQNVNCFGFVIEFWKCVYNIIEYETIFVFSLDRFQTHYQGPESMTWNM